MINRSDFYGGVYLILSVMSFLENAWAMWVFFWVIAAVYLLSADSDYKKLNK